MKKIVILTGILAANISLVLDAQKSEYDSLPTENGIAAIVESTIITHEELRKDLAPLVPQLQRKARTNEEFQKMLSDLQQDVLMNLIDRVLIQKEFNEKFVAKGYQMPRSFVENRFDDTLINEFNNDRAKFLEYLKSQGLSMREYRAKLQEEVVVQIMLSQQRRSRSILSPAKIENFYNENKNRFYQEERVHMKLIRLAPYASENIDLLMQTATKIIEELEGGAEFEELAKKYSQDTRKDKGGDWGWINRSDIRDELSGVAFSLATGTHSEPIQVKNDIFILKIEDRKEAGVQPLAEVRDQIEGILVGQLAREEQDKWLESLRKKAFIKFYL
jgi:peptidyl-prolyl cis-trans isomerase SurA